MTKLDLTLWFVWQLLVLQEDPRAFEKYCISARNKEQYEKNKPKRMAYQKSYRLANLEKCRASLRAAHHKNSDMANLGRRLRRLSNLEEERARDRKRNKSPQYRNQQNVSARKRRREDPSIGLLDAMRHRMRGLIFKGRKSAKTCELLGVSDRKEFLAIMSAKLPPEWNWDNYGVVWEIDHRRPCKSFDLTDPVQQKECWHHSNLQPLLISENRSKGAKWDA